MKKLFTLFCLAATVFAVNAQNSNYKPVDGSSISKMKLAPSVTKKHFNNEARAASYSFMLDYDGADETYSTNAGFDYQRYVWDVNRNYSNADFALDYAAVFFDTLLYVDQNTGGLSFYPKSATTLTLDSFDIFFVHENTTGNTDSITFTVFNTAQKVVTGYGSPGATFTTPSLWDTTIATNTSIPLNTSNFTIATFYPNLAFAQGQTFGVRVDFVGDTANKFQILAGYRDQCLGACFAETAIAGNNSAYYLDLTTSTGTNLSGYFENDGQGAIFYDCDQSNGFTVGGCENFPIQNIVVIPYVTASINYGATIVADSLKGCPNAQLNLSANAFGSTATPYTYNWATTSGNLTSTTDQQVSLVVGATNATVSVTVTDANNVTTTASVLVKSNGINVNITNPNPLNIACGGGATTVLTSISGVTAGKNYLWSTGASGSNQATIQVSTPGNYSVTVTNNTGCSASASLTVQYQGGVTNSVSIGSPTPNPVCQGKEVTFPNNSVNKNGWTPTWDFGDTNLGFTLDGVHTYANPGVFPVSLKMDSAGCSFVSSNLNVTVLPASNSACLSGIEDVQFSNSISLLPNPTNGNVNITVNAVEKNISIKVYNIIGSEVMNFSSAEMNATFSKSFDFSSLSNGTYLVKISSGDKVAIKRLTITK